MSPIFMGSSARPTGMASVGFRAPLLNGEQGTAQTIALMRKLVDEALSDSQFVRQAIDIVRSRAAYDDFGEAEALYDWVKRNIRFTKDPVTKEKLYPPQELLKIRAGDCDDISMLLGALLMAVGYNARLITVSANRQSPSEFSHVYVEAEVPPTSGNWIPMDAARVDSQFGTEPPIYFRKKAWSLSDDSSQELSGGRPRGALSGYARHLGDGSGDEINWGNIISQGMTEIPAIMSTAGGGGSSVATPAGTVSTFPNSPYGSFATPYTPGYGIPPAGYGSSVYGSVNTGGSVLPWLIGGGLLLLFFSRRGR